MTAKEQKAKVYQADRWGLRDAKYEWLEGNDSTSTDWEEVHPRSGFYLFVPRDEEVFKRYSQFLKVTNIFPVNNVGIVTSRDRFVFDFDENTLKRRVRMFIDQSLPDEIVSESLGISATRTWSLNEARSKVQQDKRWESKILKCLYRPFDTRWLFYHDATIERPAKDLMRHLMPENLALLVKRQGKRSPYSYAFLTNRIAESCVFESAFANNTVCPLHLHPEVSKEHLFATSKADKEPEPNLSAKVLETLTASYSKRPTPEEIFCYIYAVLYSNIYRERYVEFLRIDFPRIPFTKDVKLFQKLAGLGERLVDLHLLRSSELDPPIARFQGEGENRVQTGKKGLRYGAEKQRVYINEKQYFEGVPSEVWEYPIGGYQVCHKWLKDRKDRCLTLEEIKTYCRIVTALSKTITIQADIDKLYPQVEKTLLPIQLEPSAL